MLSKNEALYLLKVKTRRGNGVGRTDYEYNMTFALHCQANK